MITMNIHNVTSTSVRRSEIRTGGCYFDSIEVTINTADGCHTFAMFVPAGQVLGGISETPAEPAVVPYTSDEQIGCEAAFVDAAAAAVCRP